MKQCIAGPLIYNMKLIYTFLAPIYTRKYALIPAFYFPCKLLDLQHTFLQYSRPYSLLLFSLFTSLLLSKHICPVIHGCEH